VKVVVVAVLTWYWNVS